MSSHVPCRLKENEDTFASFPVERVSSQRRKTQNERRVGLLPKHETVNTLNVHCILFFLTIIQHVSSVV